MSPNFVTQCPAYGDHLITTKAFWAWIVSHHVWDVRLHLGLWDQIVNWCSPT